MEGCRYNQASHCQRKKTGCGLGNDRVEMLLQAIDASKKETHSHDEEKVREHTSDKGSLYNQNFTVDQRNNSYNQFDGIASVLLVGVTSRSSRNSGDGLPKTCVEETTDCFASARVISYRLLQRIRISYRMAISSVA